MRRLRFNRPSPAMVVACVALFVALGGTAFAVQKIGTNQIKSKAVTKKKLAKQSVASAKIVKQAVKKNKIADEAVVGEKVLDGSLSLAKVAQIVVDRNPTVPGLLPGECAVVDVAVEGVAEADRVLVLRRGPDYDNDLNAFAGPTGAGAVQITFCNVHETGATIEQPQQVTLAVFK